MRRLAGGGRALGALGALMATVACAPAPEAVAQRSASWVRDAIVGGTLTTGDPNVFLLLAQTETGQGGLCTATLIGSRTLITAAHCVDPAVLGASQLQLYATNAPRRSLIEPSVNGWPVTETRTHPDWNSRSLEGDLAFALLPVSISVAPKPFSALDPAPFVGQAIRAVGYGTTGGEAGGGLKRTVDLTLRDVSERNLLLGDQVQRGICHGDSGGPTFMTVSDGVERLIGVHSFTRTQDCLDGADTRLDRTLVFIQAWLQEKEAPSCSEDGRCKEGCEQPDLDCFCQADGRCTAACPVPARDPDCPRDCGPTGICAAELCPVPDPDCIIERGVCSADEQCRARRCVVDPAHRPYCSTACAADADCPGDMRCDATRQACLFRPLTQVPRGSRCSLGQNVCSGGAVCTGLSAQATSCAPLCRASSDCATGLTCDPGFDGQLHCHRPPVTLPVLAVAEGPAAPAPGLLGLGCSIAGDAAGGGLLPLLAASVAMCLPGRRRSGPRTRGGYGRPLRWPGNPSAPSNSSAGSTQARASATRRRSALRS
jgi:hypothetical protein